MRPFRTEPELVGDVGQLDGVPLGARVGEGALFHQHVVTPVGRGLQGALLVERRPIPGQVAAA